MGNYLQSNNTLMTHLVTLTVAWVFLADIAVYAALWKHRVCGYYVHVILGWLIIIITLIMTLIYIIPKGLPNQCFIHENIQCDPYQFPLAIEGTILTVWMAFQVFSGIFARGWQENPKARSISVMRSKKFHQFSGYIVMLLGKVNTFIHWRDSPFIWIPLIVFEVSFIVLYIKTKWFFKTMEQTITDPLIQKTLAQSQKQIRKVRYVQELQKGKSEYTIFADYVYDITPLMTLHPAGYQVIEICKGRQVDRFMYGMYSAELTPEVPPFSHPYNSFQLTGKPIAKIDIINPYSNMEDLNDCKIAFKQTVCQKSDIHIIGLRNTNSSKPFIFKGYSDIAQAGQYFSMTVDGITRLYTTVNTLSKKNRRLMEKISHQMKGNQPIYISESKSSSSDNKSDIKSKQSKKTDQKKSQKKFQQIILNTAQSTVRIQEGEIMDIHSELYDEDYCVPFMIKKYEKGKLTPILINDQNQTPEIILSRPRGQGLKVETNRPGNIIFVAGGTGFYPFMDIIDLLFKQKVIRDKIQSYEIRDRILRQNPVLKEEIFKDYCFQIFVSIMNAQDIHPISLYQLNALCEEPENYQVTFRISSKQKKHSFQQKYPRIKITTEFFNDTIVQESQKDSTSKIYLCGPPMMNTSIAQKFKENGKLQILQLV